MKGGGINKRLIKIYKRSKFILSVKKDHVGKSRV
jgi:hypothetical protein